jgi:hypothetical protein
MAEDFGLLPWQLAPAGYGILPVGDRYAAFRQGAELGRRHVFIGRDANGNTQVPLTFATPLEAADFCRAHKAKHASIVE